MDLIERGYDVDQIDEDEGFGGVHELNLLYSEYEPHSWWFEIFEFVRRLLLVGVSVFFSLGSAADSSQIVYGLLVCLLAISVYENWKPFLESSDDRVSIICQWQIFFLPSSLDWCSRRKSRNRTNGIWGSLGLS